MAVTVEELRVKLISLGLSKEDVDNIKGKQALVNAIETLEGISSVDTTIEPTLTEDSNISVDTALQEEKQPSMFSPEWEKYVLSQFSSEELVDGKYPNLPGLRRVAGLLLGEVISSKPVQTQVSLNEDGPGRASVVYEIQIAWKRPSDANYLSPIRTFCGMGGSWHGNTDDLFAVYPEAIAEARAEARAYRKALQLKVVAADEITRKDTAEVTKMTVNKGVIPLTTSDNEKIKDSQINAIKNICSRLDIDLNSFINMGTKQYGNIEEVQYDTAKKMIAQLSKYQSGGPDSQEVPEHIKKKG